MEFLNNSLEEIAQLALERKTGARALRSIVEKILLLAKFEVPGSNIEKIRISKNCVLGLESYEYVRRRIEPINVAVGGNWNIELSFSSLIQSYVNKNFRWECMWLILYFINLVKNLYLM